jgi:hypothetical protein
MGIIFSVFFIISSIPSLIGSFKEWSGSSYYLNRNPQRELVLYITAAFASYGLGWVIRWIVTGESKSVINRLKK